MSDLSAVIVETNSLVTASTATQSPPVCPPECQLPQAPEMTMRALRAAVLADMGRTITSGWMFGPELASGAVRRVLEDSNGRARRGGRARDGGR
jgi:hypothetical protein